MNQVKGQGYRARALQGRVASDGVLEKNTSSFHQTRSTVLWITQSSDNFYPGNTVFGNDFDEESSSTAQQLLTSAYDVAPWWHLVCNAYTVLSRKSAHGRCILLSHQTGPGGGGGGGGGVGALLSVSAFNLERAPTTSREMLITCLH